MLCRIAIFVFNKRFIGKFFISLNCETIRKKFIFTGRVQKVGFRLEVSLIAKKLGLTGWVKNTPQGEVEAEIQGEKDKIAFLIKFMKSLKRIKIVKVEEQVMEVIDTEDEFIVIK